jgi:hypothetical protein
MFPEPRVCATSEPSTVVLTGLITVEQKVSLDTRLASETIRRGDRASSQSVGRALMLVMQEDRELLPFRFALGHHRFFKEMVLNVLWQVAPNPDNGFPKCTEDQFFGFSRQFSHR